MTGGSLIVLENTGSRFLFLPHMAAAMLELLEMWLVWSAKIALKTDACSTILAIQSEG